MSAFTAALAVGLTALSAVNTMSAAKDESDAAIEEGNIASENKAKETKLAAARQESSFLSSGLTLEGTPMASINETYETGLSDLAQIKSNYETKASNIMSQARSQVLTRFATTAATMGLFSGASGATGDLTTSSFNYANQGFDYSSGSLTYL